MVKTIITISISFLIFGCAAEMKYKPFKEQQFWGDTYPIIRSRLGLVIREEDKVLGSPVKSGIDYANLEKTQDCPVIPLHLASFREENNITILMKGHPYWQMFEFGTFEFEGREIKYCWPSSYSGRQVFVASDADMDLYEFFRDHMGGTEVQHRPISFKKQWENDKLSYSIETELPSGEKFEAYLEYEGKPMNTYRYMVPFDNHALDKALLVGGMKGKGSLGDPQDCWVKIDGVKHDFGKAVHLMPFIILGEINVVFAGVFSYNREATITGDSFSITNPSNRSEISYSIKRNKDEVEYVNIGPLNESKIKARLIGEAEEIYEIQTVIAGQQGLSMKFNPSIPDLRYPFKEPYVGKFFLSVGDFKGIVIGNVQAKHTGKFIVFDFLPEKPRQAKERSMQMTINFTDKDKYQITSQIYSR